jgi:hypothetical protein
MQKTSMKSLNARVPVGLLDDFAVECAKRGRMNMKTAVAEALTMWLATPAGDSVAMRAAISARDALETVERLKRELAELGRWCGK